jgi:hypothetical protein
MTAEEIRDVVRQVLNDERSKEEVDEAVLRTVSAILSSFGIDHDERKEIQADFAHLRKWRKSVEAVERAGVKTVVAVLVTGLLGALWLGFKVMMGK